MEKGIVVGTWSGGKDWANRLLASLEPVRGHIPLYVVINDGYNADNDWVQWLATKYSVVISPLDAYEPGILYAVVNYTPLEEFWLFQDSIEITDISFLPTTLDMEGQTFSYASKFMMCYMGKYQTKILKTLYPIKEIHNKYEACLWEVYFNHLYYFRGKEMGAPEPLVVDTDFDWANPANYLQNLYGEDRLVAKGHHLLKRLSLRDENIPNLIDYMGLPNLESLIEKWRANGSPQDSSGIDTTGTRGSRKRNPKTTGGASSQRARGAKEEATIS